MALLASKGNNLPFSKGWGAVLGVQKGLIGGTYAHVLAAPACHFFIQTLLFIAIGTQNLLKRFIDGLQQLSRRLFKFARQFLKTYCFMAREQSFKAFPSNFDERSVCTVSANSLQFHAPSPLFDCASTVP